MSPQEFEDYLARLGRQLRAASQQRDSIADELRDHLQERLIELLQRGHEHDEAVRISLEEFGDAAQLAAQLVSVSRIRRRRWVMRMTVTGFVALVALIMALATFWPSSPKNPYGGSAVAQVPGEKTDPFAGDPFASGGESPPESIEQNNARTQEKLAKRLAAEFIETPLRDLLDYVGESLEVQIYINRQNLDDHGVTGDEPVTMNLQQVRGDMLLDLALDQVGGLAYGVRDGIVIVSTEDDLETTTEVRVYNCRDLLAIARGEAAGMPGMAAGMDDLSSMMGGMSGGMGDLDGNRRGSGPSAQLITVLVTTVDPDTWEDAGGYGTIAEFSGLLVVNHNVRVHQKIEKLLLMLQQAATKR